MALFKDNFIKKSSYPQSLLFLFFAVTSFAYIVLSYVPFPSDSCYYFFSAVKLFKSDSLPEGLLYIFKYPIPPLLIVLPFFIFKIFGVLGTLALVVPVVFYLFSLLSVYKTTLFLSDKKRALTALVIFGSTPLVFGMSRAFMTDMVLAGNISFSFMYLLKSNNFSLRKETYLFAFFCRA